MAKVGDEHRKVAGYGDEDEDAVLGQTAAELR